MRSGRIVCSLAVVLLMVNAIICGQQAPAPAQAITTVRLADVRMRDVCILADNITKTYYAVSSTFVRAGEGRGLPAVRAYTSKDLVTWEGPHIVFTSPPDFWGDINIRAIWAPELHVYQGKYYLFQTFNTQDRFPEQWRNWLPRVTRGSQVLVSDSPTGPFKPFQDHSTLPVDMMTLDGTLWVEDGIPFMVFCHEWVQIKDGTIEYIQLKDDLSEVIGGPTRMFDGSDAVWSHKSRQYSSHVTDGPYLYRSKSDKLFMIWSSSGAGGYTTGIAISESGQLSGPWKQQAEPVYKDDGGHGMLFKTFDGKLMMVLHAPNGPAARPHIFEMEDTGDTLRIVREFTGANPQTVQP